MNQNELNVFLYDCTGRFYESSQISRAEDRLDLTRKVASFRTTISAFSSG